MKFISRSVSDTFRIARKIRLKPADIILLKGELGTGKTTFAKGLLSGLGFDKNKVVSSSFVLISHYKNSRYSVFHIDLYRLNKKDVVGFTDFWEILEDKKHIKIIEWPQAVENMLPKKAVKVTLSYKGPKERVIAIKGGNLN